MTDRSRPLLAAQALIASLLILIGLGTASAAAEKRIQFNIVAQDLASALNEFARQSAQELLFSTDLAASKRTSGIVGEFAPTDALKALLQGTGLRYRINDDKTILIEIEKGDLESARRAGMPASAFMTPMMAAQAMPAFRAAQDPEGDAQDSSADSNSDEDAARLGDMLVTTGTHIPGATTASPIFIFDRTDFDNAGATTLQQFLGTVPQNFNNTKGDDTVTRENGLNFELGSAVNLRGLGATATLVLIDGHRLAAAGTGDYVDISMIPLSAIERIEILPDGASAVYGSDAVGGVINLIMRKEYQGAETRLHAGRTTQGGGEEYQGQQSFSVGWGSGGALLSYEFNTQDPVLSFERDFSADTFPELGSGPVFLTPDHERHSIYLSGRQDLSDRVALTASYIYADRNTHWASWDPFLLEVLESVADSQQYGAMSALKVQLSDAWRFELDGSISSNDMRSTSGQVGEQAFRWSSDYKIWSADAKVVGELFRLPGGPAQVALGVAHRDESYIFSDNLNSPPEGNFTIGAAFAEVVVPVVGGSESQPDRDRLTLTLAGRYEDHSSFGTTLDPKIGLRWAPSGMVALRGTYGTSFKAPTLFQQNEFNGRNAINNRPDPSSPDGNGTSRTISRLGNNPDLQEETATTWTVGADLTPSFAEGSSISLTYFEIEYEDRIEQSVSFPNLLLSDPSYEVLVTRRGEIPDAEFNALVAGLLTGRLPVTGCAVPVDPSTRACSEPLANFEAILDRRLFNVAGTRTSGFDFTASQRFTGAAGVFDLSLNSTYLFDFERQVTSAFPAVEFVDTVGNPIDLKIRASASWSRDGWVVTAMLNYSDGYTQEFPLTPSTPASDVSSWTTLDLTVRFDTLHRYADWLNDTALSLTVLNVFDKNPPFIADPFFGLGYDPANADPLGRVVSLTVGKSW